MAEVVTAETVARVSEDHCAGIVITNEIPTDEVWQESSRVPAQPLTLQLLTSIANFSMTCSIEFLVGVLGAIKFLNCQI